MIQKRLNISINPYNLYLLINREFEESFLLESIEGDERLARFSFIGFAPSKHIRAKNNIILIDDKKIQSQSPLDILSKNIPYIKSNKDGFIGGAVGYVSYDYIRNLESIPNKARDDLDFPDFEFGIFEDCIIFDHKTKIFSYISHTKDRSKDILTLSRDRIFSSPFETGKLKTNMNKEDFKKKIKTAKEYIINGDIFQVVISRRYEFPFEGNIIRFYNALKKINPSPYMYFLSFKERKIIGASPENLIRIQDKKIESYATMAGTMPRGKDKKEDLIFQRELLSDKKELAEHQMLVDLTRNDIGKIARFNSVKVSEFMAVHKYSHVQHLCSNIVGELQDGKDCFDAFNSIFPAGTLTGAPKIRAMEIIEELESVRRGPYGGAVGYFSFNRNCDFAITIRTLFAKRQKAYIQAGAGIVYDSIPEKEFQETENKMQALIKSITE